nr:DpnD/PcfM family protein [uncultured Agathobaculum sp.]
MKYKVDICEEFKATVYIDADSPEEAQDIAENRWFTGEYELGDRNFDHVEFYASAQK